MGLKGGSGAFNVVRSATLYDGLAVPTRVSSPQFPRLELGGEMITVPGTTASDDLGLTSRERDVLLLLAEGRTNRQIGEQLFISEKTASVHVCRILAKLGVANRAEAAGIAHTLSLSTD